MGSLQKRAWGWWRWGLIPRESAHPEEQRGQAGTLWLYRHLLVHCNLSPISSCEPVSLGERVAGQHWVVHWGAGNGCAIHSWAWWTGHWLGFICVLLSVGKEHHCFFPTRTYGKKEVSLPAHQQWRPYKTFRSFWKIAKKPSIQVDRC